MRTKTKIPSWVMVGLMLFGLVALTGCPKAPYPAAIRIMESPKGLKKGQVKIEANGGSSLPVGAGVVGGRIRVGVGGNNEIGVTGNAWLGGNASKLEIGGGLKLDWKHSWSDHFAITLGAGMGIGDPTTTGLTFDAGMIYSPLRDAIRPYLGLRFGLVGALHNEANSYFGVVCALGVEVDMSKYASFVLETGTTPFILLHDNTSSFGAMFYVSGGLQFRI
jgi:hypothetical protein